MVVGKPKRNAVCFVTKRKSLIVTSTTCSVCDHRSPVGLHKTPDVIPRTKIRIHHSEIFDISFSLLVNHHLPLLFTGVEPSEQSIPPFERLFPLCCRKKSCPFCLHGRRNYP